MATILSSAITTVNIPKLKKQLESISDVKVLSIKPKKGLVDTSATLVRLNGDDLTPAQIIAAQAVLDTHVDTQEENLRLLAHNQTIVGNTQSGEILFHNNNQARWKISSSHELLPVSASYNLGSLTSRVGAIYAQSLNLSGNATIDGDLLITGTTTTIHTTELNISDNIITLNDGQTGTPILNAGIVTIRGDAPNAQILWNESTDKWQVGIVGDMQNVVLQNAFDTHVTNTSNPHSVTKSQVGLNNVTNDAQLKRAAGDYNSFPSKAVPSSGDIFLIEDSDDSWNKKKITLATTELSTLIENAIPSGVIDGINTVFTLAYNYVPGSVRLYLNGMRQTPGASFDFVEGGTNVINFNHAPESGDRILADYRIL